jgi:hypothetical protein
MLQVCNPFMLPKFLVGLLLGSDLDPEYFKMLNLDLVNQSRFTTYSNKLGQ